MSSTYFSVNPNVLTVFHLLVRTVNDTLYGVIYCKRDKEITMSL